MRRSVALRWVVGALVVVAIALAGVFANLAVLNSGSAEGSIGTLSAKGITQVSTADAPPIVAPAPDRQATPATEAPAQRTPTGSAPAQSAPAQGTNDDHGGRHRDRDDD